MNKYLLLRDNKESGPYTVAEIISKGIKAYDLVWLEGKSAAWRYPGEVEELKPFAPLVEEQPFDRFYKKDPENKKTINENKSDALKTDTIKKDEAVTDHSIYQPKIKEGQGKKVYINFPGARSPDAREKTRSPDAREKIDAFLAEPISEPLQQTVHERLRNKSSMDEKAPYAGEKSPARQPDTDNVSLDQDGPYPPSFKTPIENKEGRKFFSGTSSWVIASCLLLAGVLIGLAANNIGRNKNIKELNTVIQQIQDREKQKIKEDAADQVILTGNTLKDIPAGNEHANTPGNALASSHEDNRRPVSENNNSTSAARPDMSKQDIKSGSAAQEKIDNKQALTGETADKKKTAAAITRRSETQSGTALAPNEINRENIYKQVSVKGNKYKTGVLGGISNLQLELTNNSLYNLQQVEVEVKYLGMEKKLVKSQTVYFRDVSPGEQLVMDVPKTNRGISVEYMISRID